MTIISINNEHFADLCNAVLFEGNEVIRAEELEDADTEESSVLEHREYAESITASRDNIKVQKTSTEHGVQFVLLGLKHQEHVHYAMPMRVMGYDYGVYKKQYDSNAKKYQQVSGMEEDEYLSRMKKTDRFIPVVTIVVHYGEKVWDGATSLHEMSDISEEMKPFPKNEAKQKAMQYSREHKVDKTVIMTVAGAANMKLNYNALAEKGDGDMCTLFEEIAKEGKAEGIIDTCLELGLSESEILERLQKKLSISLQAAQEYLKMFGKQTV